MIISVRINLRLVQHPATSVDQKRDQNGRMYQGHLRRCPTSAYIFLSYFLLCDQVVAQCVTAPGCNLVSDCLYFLALPTRKGGVALTHTCTGLLEGCPHQVWDKSNPYNQLGPITQQDKATKSEIITLSASSSRGFFSYIENIYFHIFLDLVFLFQFFDVL